MLGLIALGLGCYAVHAKKKANSYKIARHFERCIDKGEDCEISGLRFLIDHDEIVKIMEEDGYDVDKYEYYDD